MTMAGPPSSVDWQTNCTTIRERGEYLLKSGRWSDCRFIVGTAPHQKTYDGHKLILAMSSPVFEAMFFGGIPETVSPIPICDVHPDGFKALLEYIYCDCVNLTSFDQACELCYVAKKYMLPHLVKRCTEHIWQDIRSDNACRAYEFAKLFEEHDLLQKSLQVICDQTSTILRESSFDDIDKNTLDVILQQDVLKIESEMELFQAMERWAKRACNRRGLPVCDGKSMREILGELVGKIRYLTMTAQEFAEGPALSDLLTKEERLAIFVNLSSSEGGKRCPMPESFSASVLSREVKEFDCADYNICHCSPFTRTETINNPSSMDCTIAFTVSRRIQIVGVRVPTQIRSFTATTNTSTRQRGSDDSPVYSELLYAHLLDRQGSRLTYTHYTSRVMFNSTIDISFNHIVSVEPHTEYRIGVVLNKPGVYPMMTKESEAIQNGIVFKFPTTGTRDGLFSGILYR